MGCSCSRALHLVSLIILRSVLNKTTIKILWHEHEKHDEQICTPKCYITPPPLSPPSSSSSIPHSASLSFLLGHGALRSISKSLMRRYKRTVHSSRAECAKGISCLFHLWDPLPVEIGGLEQPGVPPAHKWISFRGAESRMHIMPPLKSQSAQPFMYCKSVMLMIKATVLASPLQQQRHLTSFPPLHSSSLCSSPSPTTPGAVSTLEIIDAFTA